MPPTLEEMTRQLHAFALDEMKNRGLEDAARFIERRIRDIGFRMESSTRYQIEAMAREVRALKTDPSRHLTDWWAEDKTHVA